MDFKDVFNDLADRYPQWIERIHLLRLKDAVTYRLEQESFEHFKERCIKEGARDGQFKLNLLLQDEVRHAKFNDLVKK